MAHLDGFVGILQVDGYSGYRPLAAKNTVSLAFCWSHVRRKFYDLAASSPAATERANGWPAATSPITVKRAGTVATSAPRTA